MAPIRQNDGGLAVDDWIAMLLMAHCWNRLTYEVVEVGMASKFESMDEYLSALPADQRAVLEKLRQTILATAPGAEECFSYGMPAFRFEGKILVAFAARTSHCALYPMSGETVAAFMADLAGYDTSIGTIRFQPGHPLPVPLIRKLVKARIQENRRRS
jgi:uncharacterized protein YdhG (YjbR/CyaY superfamily)